MLCSRNSGKLLSKQYAEDLEACARGKDQYTTEEQAYLELPAGGGRGDDREEQMTIDTSPLDPLQMPVKDAVDIRKLPGRA